MTSKKPAPTTAIKFLISFNIVTPPIQKKEGRC